MLATLGGDVRVLHNGAPVGIVHACNQAAAVARGRFLAFVPPGTLPCAGWLRTLILTAEGDPAAAAVSSLVGGAPGSEGLPGLLVRRDRFQAVGGFVEEGAAAVADLCARLRGRGERVVHAPGSVIEWRGQTAVEVVR